MSWAAESGKPNQPAGSCTHVSGMAWPQNTAWGLREQPAQALGRAAHVALLSPAPRPHRVGKVLGVVLVQLAARLLPNALHQLVRLQRQSGVGWLGSGGGVARQGGDCCPYEMATRCSARRGGQDSNQYKTRSHGAAAA